MKVQEFVSDPLAPTLQVQAALGPYWRVHSRTDNASYGDACSSKGRR